MTGVRAVVPIRSLADGKTRLAGVLSDTERETLNREMLRHCLQILATCRGIGHVSVVTRDDGAAELAAHHGADVVRETAPAGLNAALSEALATLGNADAALILPADLPRLAVDDVEAVLATKTAIVVAPDNARSGTNALLLRPPNVIGPVFGPDSFGLHLEAAASAGLKASVVQRPGLAFDLDTPEDYSSWRTEGLR